jgi:hypothetical protein
MLDALSSGHSKESAKATGFDAMVSFADDKRKDLLVSAAAQIGHAQEDFKALISRLRRSVLRDGTLPGPCLFHIADARTPVRVDDTATTQLDDFMDEALKLSAFVLPESQKWVPGDRPATVEIRPILLYRPEDAWWSVHSHHEVEIALSSSDILGGRWATPDRRKAFFAYTFSNSASEEALEALQEVLSASVSFVTGREQDVGSAWSAAIRNRIVESKAFVADVTGNNSEVFFELGLAYGAGIPLVPFVQLPGHRATLPAWLPSKQIPAYNGGAGLEDIRKAVSQYITDRRKFIGWPALPRRAEMRPQTVVLVVPSDVDEKLIDRLRQAAVEHSCEIEVFDLPSSRNAQDIREQFDDIVAAVLRCGIFIGAVDGTENDLLINFLLGAMAAHPNLVGSNLGRGNFYIEPETGPTPTGGISQAAKDYSAVVKSLRSRGRIEVGRLIKVLKKVGGL